MTPVGRLPSDADFLGDALFHFSQLAHHTAKGRNAVVFSGVAVAVATSAALVSSFAPEPVEMLT